MTPPPPTGSVVFADNGSLLAVVLVFGSTAVLTTPLPLGTHNITAFFTLCGKFPSASDTATVLVTNNHFPTLASIPSQFGQSGQAVTFVAQGADVDAGEILTYSLDPGAPPSATIDPTTGLFSWTAPIVTVPTDYSFTVRVTDNGIPALSAAQAAIVHVRTDLTPLAQRGGGPDQTSENLPLSWVAETPGFVLGGREINRRVLGPQPSRPPK